MRVSTPLLAALLLCGCAHRWPEREAIHPQPTRPYSQAVRVGRTYYFAGKVGVTDSTKALATGRTGAEVRNVLESFKALFAEQGLSLADAVQATVYLADVADFDEMNRVYAEYFPANPPARETVAVGGLMGGARVEISLIAVRKRR